MEADVAVGGFVLTGVPLVHRHSTAATPLFIMHFHLRIMSEATEAIPRQGRNGDPHGERCCGTYQCPRQAARGYEHHEGAGQGP